MKHLENRVIGYMRAAIANFDTDSTAVYWNKYDAHDLFGKYLMAWSEEFCVLYQKMLAIYNARTPQETGHYHTRHKRWVVDNQPPAPTSVELLERFSALIQCWDVSLYDQEHRSLSLTRLL